MNGMPGTRTEGESGREGRGGAGVGLRNALLEALDALPARLDHGDARPHLFHDEEGEADAHDLYVVRRCMFGW